MKKNLTRKLALSAVTMGVAALTVTSTTYAWYTNNSEATASGLKATADTADGNLLIYVANGNNNSMNDDGTNGVAPTKGYSKTATLTNDGTKSLLLPTQWNSTDSKWKPLIGNTDMASNVLNEYIWFSVDVPAGKNMDVQLKVTGVTSTSKTKTNEYAHAESEAESWTVSLTDALGLRVSSFGTTVIKKQGTSDAGSGEASVEANKLYRYQVDAKKTESDKTIVDAITYYQRAMGDTTTVTDNLKTTYDAAFDTTYYMSNDGYLTVANVKNTGTEAANIKFGLCFTFFLDGWDYQCSMKLVEQV